MAGAKIELIKATSHPMTAIYRTNGALYLLDPPVGQTSIHPVKEMDRAAMVTSWSFQTQTEVIDITPLGDTDRTHVDGLRSLTGNCTIIYDYGQNGGKILEKVIHPRKGRAGLAEEQIGGFQSGGEDNARFVLRLALSKLTNIDNIDRDQNDTVRWMQMRVMFTQVAMASTVGTVTQVDAQWQANGAPEFVKWTR